jgi:hypothetical protein
MEVSSFIFLSLPLIIITRNLFGGDEKTSLRKLACIVHYVRRELYSLDKIEGSLIIGGYVHFHAPINPSDPHATEPHLELIQTITKEMFAKTLVEEWEDELTKKIKLNLSLTTDDVDTTKNNNKESS